MLIWNPYKSSEYTEFTHLEVYPILLKFTSKPSR